MNEPAPLIFLKLGGSLITDKHGTSAPRPDVLRRLAQEIAAARQDCPHLRLVLGHGSGSFGHVPAKRHHTRQGVSTPEQWLGFAEVWREARALNDIVVQELCAAGLPVIAFPPSAAIFARGAKVSDWDHRPLQAALDHHLLPLVQGDVAFDHALGGTILSTEDVFEHLTLLLRPQRILLAGIEAGVWEDFPACTRLIPTLTPSSFPALSSHLGGSAAVDVTGGMAQKVTSMLALIQRQPGLQVLIFSGEHPGNLHSALCGQNPGTLLLGD